MSQRFLSRLTRALITCLSVLTVLILATGCSKSEIIAHDLDEREANEILVFLSDRGVEAIKEKAEAGGGGGGNEATKWNISVDAGSKREAMAVLSQAGLPRRPGQNLLNLFKESGLVPSELQQQVRYQAGLSEQIASVIRKMDGVVDAEVQLSVPKQDPLNPNAPKEKTTASVYVKHTGILNDPNSHLISNIKNLVSGAVPGLSYDDVTVVPDLARYRGGEGGGTPLEGEELRSGTTPLVSVWTLVLAKDSVTRFRIVFFSFFIGILMLLATLVVLIWKLMPLVQAASQQGVLYSFRRIEVADLMPKSEADKEKEEPKSKKKRDEEDEEEDEEETDEEEES